MWKINSPVSISSSDVVKVIGSSVSTCPQESCKDTEIKRDRHEKDEKTEQLLLDSSEWNLLLCDLFTVTYSPIQKGLSGVQCHNVFFLQR